MIPKLRFFYYSFYLIEKKYVGLLCNYITLSLNIFPMKKLIILIFFLPYFAFTQVIDNFNDGDFYQNPTWIGNDTSFVIENFQLRSNGPQATSNTIYLCTSNTLINNIEWSFLIDLKFNPTSSNIVRIYLTANQSDLTTATDAYYIEIGQTNQDYINFYKKINNIPTLLFTGTTAFANNVKVRIKVTRDNSANWCIFSDNTGGFNYISEGNNFTENSIISTSYFGLYCQYITPTRFNQYYFDDISISNIVIDTIAPLVNSIVAMNSNSLDVLFSEETDANTSENINNYQVNNGINNPVSATKDGTNKSMVHLFFNQSFAQDFVYQIDINNISDLKGNIMLPTIRNFSYHKPQLYDIVINEIMTDENPAPPILPASDYIELFNRTSQSINLNNWKIKLKDDLAFMTIGNITLLPDSFLILSDDGDIAALHPYCSNIFGFTTFAINNENVNISLADNFGNIIHSIYLTKLLYNDVGKQEGGWSIEQIDPNNPCGDINNWRASVDQKGGTPGKKNSVYTPNPDLIPPFLSRICVLNKYAIKLTFNEKMNAEKLQNIQAYEISNNLQISNFIIPPNEMNSIELHFNDSIKNQLVYYVTIMDTLTDCVGNSITLNTKEKFAYPSDPVVNDVIINEILFNPKDDGVDFVEIYNHSKNNIDLNKMYISSFDLNTNKIKSMYPVSYGCGTLFSGDFIVITTNPDKVKQQYFTESPNKFNKMNTLPSFNNDMGIVILSLSDSTIIDRFDYNESMHFPLLTNVDGVSLERINPDKPSQDKQNWHSAAQSVGFATPTYANSQYSEFLYLEDPITITPEIFSPDNDGYNDILNINYQFDTPGYSANVTIFNANGKPVKQLIKNELLGTKGNFIWDGIDDSNQKAIIGIYIIYIEIFDMKGNTKAYKKTAVLGGKF